MITKLNKKSVVLQNLSLQSGAAFLSYDELASLAKLQERLMDENDVHNFITRSANAPGSTEIASCVAKKYMDDPSLMDNLVVKTRFFLNLGYYFVPALSKAIDAIEVFAAKGSRLAVSDAGCGAVCCKAALQAASLNVFINTKSLKNRDTAAELNTKANTMLDTYCAKADAIYNMVRANFNQ